MELGRQEGEVAGMVLQSPLASGVRTACPGCCAEALLSRIDVFVNIDKVVRTHCLSNTSRKQIKSSSARGYRLVTPGPGPRAAPVSGRFFLTDSAD